MMRRSLALISTLACTLSCLGQRFVFRQYNEQEAGGPQYVYDLSQDPDGRLYVAAGNQALVFNGYEFNEVFKFQDESAVIARILADTRGRVWLASRTGGPLVLDSGKQKKPWPAKLEEVSITRFAEKGGSVLIGTASHGLWLADSLLNIKQILSTETGIYDFITDKHAATIIAAEEGIIVLDADGTKYTLNRGAPFSTLCMLNGDVWAGGADGLYRFGRHNSRYVCTLTPEQQPALGIGQAQSLVADDRFLWAATPAACYRVKVPGGRDSLYRVIPVGSKSGFTGAQIHCMFKDQEKNIWFGSFGDGLFQKPALRFTLHGNPGGGETADIRAVLPAGDSLIWVGDSRGLWQYARRRARWKAIDTLQGEISCLAFDQSNRILAGTSSGLYTLDPKTLSLKKKIIEGPDVDDLNVNDITVGPARLYVSTTSGLLVLHHGDRKPEWLRTNEGLLHNNVRSAFHDSKDRLWIASHGAPPYYIHGGGITSFKSIEGLQSYKINAFSEDKNGHIWIATEGDGVIRYDGKTFTGFRTENGLLSNYCAAVAASNNYVWVSHRSGLSEKSRKASFFTSYSEDQGLKAGSTRHTLHTDYAGSLWIGTGSGLVSYNPAPDEMPHRKTTILAVFIDNEKFSGEQRITKQFGNYNVRIRFLSVSLTNPASITYRYRLHGADTSWQVTTQREVVFPQLAEGSYTFEVQGIRDSNKFRPGSVSFTIRPPMWRSPWFYLLLLVLVVGITYTIVVLRTRALRRGQLLLELKVKRKTFLLQREKDAVQAIRQVVEQKNKDITDSINYAKQIQDSILPAHESLQTLFGNNFFVLFMPKDIVSGDFYWASILTPESASDEVLALAAVVDCTGHGVPGAFLSIMGNDFLRQSIMEPGIHSPAEVLDFLNNKISSHLNQSSGSQLRDGMDLSLIGIDYNNKILHFSGANNPVYVFRKTESGIDQIILTATKQSIGMNSESTARFASRQFQLQSGDTIYLFSDGYADQFGGPQNKKLTYKRFRDILARAFDLPIQEQRNFLGAQLEEWKGNEAQTDDICVMGIRIP